MQSNLAVASFYHGWYNVALELQEPLLVTYKRILGDWNSCTRECKANLYATYMATEQYRKAFEILGQLLQVEENVYL